MEKFFGYVGVLVAVLFSYLLLFPVDSSPYFYRENPRINFLDRLPASYLVRSFDNKYDIYKSAKKYEACLTLKAPSECAISFSDFGSSYQTLLAGSAAFYESERERYHAGVKEIDGEFNSEMAAAAVSYSNSGVRQELSMKIYIVNLASLFLVMSVIFFRRKVGKVVMYPIFFVCNAIKSFHKKV